MLDNGTGNRTIEIVHTILHGFLKFAQREGLVAQNWAKLTEVPRPNHREMKVWDESQVSQFLQFVQADPFYRLAFHTGMRRGELLGLQWKDLDFKTGMLTVRRQAFRPEGGGFVFQPPKTETGKRAIRLGKGLIEALRIRFNETIPQMQLLAGDSWQENDLIFPSIKGTPQDGYNVSRNFHRLAVAAGLPPMRFHDIRHTCASLLLAHGEPPMRVAAILGQTVQVLLSTYAHVIDNDQERAANLMDEITTPASFQIPSFSEMHPIAPENR